MDQAEENQVPDIERWCAARGYEVARRYELRGDSAYHGEQDADQRAALDGARAGDFTVVVAWAQDRIERRGMEATLRIRRLFREAGARLEFTQEPWLNDGDDDLVLGITGWKDKQESRRKSERIRIANDAIDRAGGYRGGRPPFGYRSVGEQRRTKTMEPHPEREPVVLELFQRVAAGQGVPTVAAWLKSLGIAKTPRTNSAITATIRKPLYWTGRWETGTALHKTTAIVSRDLFLAANAALDARPTTGPRPRLPRKPDWSGRLFCGECGGKAYRMFNGDRGRRVRSYYCRACHRGWLADVADAKVEARMLADSGAEYDYVVLAGTSHQAELDRVLDELANLGKRNLEDAEHDRLQAQLRAERDELRIACAGDPPPSRELAPTGRSWGQAWESWTHAERCAYLTGHGFRIFLHGRGRSVEVERIHLPDEDE